MDIILDDREIRRTRLASDLDRDQDPGLGRKLQIGVQVLWLNLYGHGAPRQNADAPSSDRVAQAPVAELVALLESRGLVFDV